MHESRLGALEREPLLQRNEDVSSSVEATADATLPSNEEQEGELDPLISQPFELADKLRVLAVLFAFFCSGITTTVVGTLLPELEDYYDVTDSKVAFIFTAATVGYICGTFTLSSVVSHYGWRGVAFLTALSVVFHAAALSTAPPFMFVLLIQFIGCLGIGLMDAGFNAWSSKLPFVNVIQGFLHGSYSVGSVLGPMLHAALVKKGLPWYTFYRVFFVLSLIEIICSVAAFRTEDAHKFKTSHVNVDVSQQKKSPSRSRVVLLLGLFYFFYIAVEASFSNWLPSFMLRVRHADAATASLSSSVYWVGMAFGRIGLGLVTERFGLVISVTFYLLIAISLQAAFCFVESVRASFILLGLNGIFLGPMFPSGIILISRSLPNDEYIGGVAAAAAMGQVGGALCPLGIGFMAERFGLKHLSEVIVTSTSLALVSWLVSSRLTRAP